MRSSPILFFFAWGAFVFLPVNVLAGVALAKVATPSIFFISLFVGMLLLSLSVVPSVIVASKAHSSFSHALNCLLPIPVARIISGIIPIVNLGWFTIQLTAMGLMTEMLVPVFDHSLYTIFWGLVCGLGPLVVGYRWLAVTGLFAIVVAVIVTTIEVALIDPLTSVVRAQSSGGSSIADMLAGSWLVYGTWAFSSSSCVMDLARFSSPPASTVIAAIFALVLADGTLIGAGYFFAYYGLEVHSTLGIPNNIPLGLAYLFFIAGLWSTNDSNVYSTWIALRNMGFTSRIWPWVAIVISIGFSLRVGERLFDWIGQWLIVMGWISVPLTAWWWYVVMKKRYLFIKSDLR